MLIRAMCTPHTASTRILGASVEIHTLGTCCPPQRSARRSTGSKRTFGAGTQTSSASSSKPSRAPAAAVRRPN